MTNRTRIVCFLTSLGLAAGLGLVTKPTAGKARATNRPLTAPVSTAAFDPSRFILNALLVPALDVDAVPLRWVDPRPLLGCGSGTTVRANGAPLQAGALVPDAPFELEWQSNGCRPFGPHGPQFDGRVRLTVFREDWGFSAVIQPSRLQVGWAEEEATVVVQGAAWLPQCGEPDEPYEPTIGTDRSPRC